MSMSLQKVHTGPVAREVLNAERLATLPRLFPGVFVQVEMTVYSIMDKICPSYNGGYWKFYKLSNGGFYMVPEGEASLKISIPFGNGFEGELSPEAVGIVACLFMYCFLAEQRPGGDLANHYTWLMEYVYSHPECALIRAAID